MQQGPFDASSRYHSMPSVDNPNCPTADPTIVIYNRLPKSGSTTIQRLVHELGAQNHFSCLVTDFEGSDSSVTNRSVQLVLKQTKHLLRHRNASEYEIGRAHV